MMAQQLRVGLIGTGYAARRRAEAIAATEGLTLVVVAGRDRDRTQAFAQQCGVAAAPHWQQLVERPDLDLVVIASSNETHAPLAEAALRATKHVVVEYPLALEVAEAEALIQLAQIKEKLLHVEHIELLGGLHQALLAHLGQLGTLRHVGYTTIAPQSPAPRRWSFNYEQLGFPLVAALSRIHRLTQAFGRVSAVSAQSQFWPAPEDDRYFTSCLCQARLVFESGLVGEVTYGKGEALWWSERRLEVRGDRGALRFDGDQGQLITAAGEQAIALPARRGLFLQDTQAVANYLLRGEALYVQGQDSLYALRVADAARKAAQSGETIGLED